ncbi:MAG: thioredoxin family protein [Acidobacteria bacterium]|nr:thioredoxin family protein [Acidobacteriota bacterium]
MIGTEHPWCATEATKAPTARWLPAAALLLLALSPLGAAGPDAFHFTPSPATVALEAGKPGSLAVVMAADAGYYLYEDMLSFKVTAPKGVRAKAAVLPKGHLKFDLASETERMIHEGKGTVRIPLEAAADAPASGTLALEIGYQGCSSSTCFMPGTLTLKVPFTVKGAAEPAAAPEATTAAATPEPAPAEAAAPAPVSAGVSAAPLPQVFRLEEYVPAEEFLKRLRAAMAGSGAPAAKPAEDYGSVVAFVLLFFAGVVTSFTPCVYPVIPITITIFGAKKAASKLQAFLLSLIYVQGICLVYSVLGVAAASSGAVFGQYMSHPGVVGGLAAFFVLMGLYMAGVFQFNLPSSWQTKASGVGGKGYVGAFTMGMVSGVIAAPCTGPALAGVLAWVAGTGQALMGFFLLYTYAMGIGMLFLVLGTFSSLIHKLPKSGDWMEVVKGIFAVAMFAVALFYLKDVLPGLQVWGVPKPALFAGGAALLLAGFLTRWLKIDLHATTFGGVVRKFAAILVLTAGVHALVVGFSRIDGTLPWRHDLDAALAEGAKTGKPVLVDFGASWCAACKELEKYTFSDDRVRKELEGYITVKVDMTDSGTPENQALARRFGIRGLPVVLVFANVKIAPGAAGVSP